MTKWDVYLFKGDKSNLTRTAFNELKKLDKVNVKYINEMEAMSFKEFRNDWFFIFSDFRGPAFQHLRNLEMHILHPSIVLQSLKHGVPLPICRFPRINGILDNNKISSVGFNCSDKSKLYDFIEMMGGTPCSSLTESVNVLIVENVDSNKYVVAKQKKLTCLTSGWIDEIWNMSSKLVNFNPFSVDLLTKFNVPIFYKLKITLTGFNVDEKEFYRKKIVDNDGEYLVNLQKDVTTHLVAKDTSGNKFYYAVEWNIPILIQNWLDDSLKLKYCQETSKYKYSLPQNYESFHNTMILDEIDAEIDFEDNVNILNDCYFLFINCTFEIIENLSGKITELGGHTQFSRKPTHVIVGKLPFDSNLTDVLFVKPNWIIDCYEKQSKVDIDEFLFNEIDMFDISNEDFNDLEFFEDVIIYFDNCDFDFIEKYEKLIVKFGGKVLKSMNIEVTHVIVGDKKVNFKKNHCFYLNKEWLSECINLSKRMDEKLYLIKEEKEDDSEEEILATLREEDFDDDLSDSMMDCFDEELKQNESEGLFRGRRFLLTDSIGKNVVRSLVCRIYEQGGEVVVDNDKCDFIVTDVILDYPIKKGKSEVITEWYLKRCIEKNEMIKIDETVLFEPVIRSEAILTNCVMYLRGFKDDREIWCRIVKELGGCIQEALIIDNYSKFMMKTSHIVVDELDDEDMSSLKKARDNGIVVIKREWLEDCVRERKMKDSNNYLVDLGENEFVCTSDNGTVYTPNKNKDNASFDEVVDLQNNCTASPGLKLLSKKLLTVLNESNLTVQPTVSWDEITSKCEITQTNSNSMPPSSRTTTSRLPTRNKRRGQLDQPTNHNTPINSDKLFQHYENIETLSQQCVVGWKYVMPLSAATQDEENTRDIDENSHPITLGSSSNNSGTEAPPQKMNRQTRISVAKSPLIRVDSTNKRFMFSYIEDNDRSKLTECIEQLGGVYLSTSISTAQVTHLICGYPNRNEKYLSAVAAGTWILHADYLIESARLGEWAKESDYEWCHPTIRENLTKKSGIASVQMEVAGKMVDCYEYWRYSVGQDKLPFHGWNVVVIDEPGRTDKFCNILSSGGATVVQRSNCTKNASSSSTIDLSNHKSLTHIFCLNKHEFLPNFQPLSLLPTLNIIYKFQYIPEYLIQVQHKAFEPHKYLFTKTEIKQIVTFLKRKYTK